LSLVTSGTIQYGFLKRIDTETLACVVLFLAFTSHKDGLRHSFVDEERSDDGGADEERERRRDGETDKRRLAGRETGRLLHDDTRDDARVEALEVDAVARTAADAADVATLTPRLAVAVRHALVEAVADAAAVVDRARHRDAVAADARVEVGRVLAQGSCRTDPSSS
jgi:hypothetical protein